MRILKIMMCIAIVMAFTSSINPINAQNAAPTSKYGWGITNGISVNNFTYGQPHNGINLGYTGGGFIDRTLEKNNLRLRLNLGYTGAGGQLTTFKDDTRYGFDNSFTFKNAKQSSYLLHSIDSWLSLFYQKQTQHNWKYYFGLGVGMENKFFETERYEKTGEFITGIYGTVQNQQYTNRFENYWFNSNLTGGIELPTNKNFSLIIEARYLYGLTAARNNYSYIEFEGVMGEVRTNAFQLTVGVRNMFKQGKPKIKSK